MSIAGMIALGERPYEALPPRIRRVVEAARRVVGYRARAAALAAAGDTGPLSLSAAIDRDFLAFDIARAERDLRAAVIALDPDSAPVWLAEPAMRARHAGERDCGSWPATPDDGAA